MGDLFIKDFPTDLHFKLKVKAAQERKSLKAIIIELLTAALKQKKKED